MQRGRLALSGLTLSGPAEEQEAAIQAVQSNASPDVWPIPAVRRFARSGRLEYRAVIYNPAVDKSSGMPKLSAQFEIYRGDQALFQAPAAPVGTTGQTNFKRIELAGGLRLQGLPPGDYLLRVLVTDEFAKSKNNKVEQWMDFSVK